MSLIATIIGSLIGAKGAKKAANQQAEGQREALGTIREFNQPFVDFGRQNLDPLQEFVNQGGNFSDTQDFKDIINSQKAQGGTLSGNQLTALTRFQQENFRPERFNELFSIAQLGQNAAAGTSNQIATLQQNIGTARGRGTTNATNALTSGINQLTFLDLLKRQNPGAA